HERIRVLHLPVVAASGGEDESRGTGPLGCIEQGEGRVAVHGACEIRLPRARGVAHDRREMHHGIHTVERLPHRIGVAHVSLHELERRVRPHPQEGTSAVEERVEHTYLLATVEQRGNERGAQVPPAAGPDHPLASVSERALPTNATSSAVMRGWRGSVRSRSATASSRGTEAEKSSRNRVNRCTGW